MAVQTATTGQLENASREMIVAARFSEEHSTPAVSLVEQFRLAEGHDTLVVPKVGRMTMGTLVDGQEITDEQSIGMTTVNTSPSEVGGKVILTDKLLRQNTSDIWRVVGQQLGDASARIKDNDVTALYASLNGGTVLGAAADILSAAKVSRIIAVAKANRYGRRLRGVLHPNQMYRATADLATVGSGATTTRPIPQGISERQLGDFFRFTIGGVPWFEDGNITRDSSGDSVGAIFNSDALGFLTSVAMKRERERRATLRGWVLVVSSDYSAFEIDDTKGAGLRYDSADPSTTT